MSSSFIVIQLFVSPKFAFVLVRKEGNFMGFLSKKFQLNDAHVFHRLLAVRFLLSIIYILLMVRR
jgi:hypothetical protein